MRETIPPPPDAALWRYGIISEFLHGDPDGRTLSERLAQAALRTWSHPSGRPVQPSADTLRHWLYRYRRDGLPGLADRVRSDRGTTEIPPAVQAGLRRLRALHPHHTTERLARTLLEEGVATGRGCPRSSLHRFARAQGLGRVPAGAQAPAAARAFEYGAFGNMWTADFLHGPRVRIGKSLHRTYLLAIIDDASRFVVQARFHWSEGTESLLDGLSLAVRRFGVPERFYTDNGSAFRSDHLKLVAGRLGMDLPHTPAYRPQGRGKIERLFRTVRDQWLPEGEAGSLEVLNGLLSEWLNTYHHAVHSSLGQSPLDRRLALPSALRELPAVSDVERLFRMQARRKVARNGTVSVLGRTFDVGSELPGTEVVVSYLPWKLDGILVGPKMVPARPVDLERNAQRHLHNPLRGKEARK
jgi:transposase InsO family protein